MRQGFVISVVLLLFPLLGVSSIGHARIVSNLCGSLDNAYGPYDYRTATREQKRLVEGAHFTGSVETLQKGKSTSHIAGDIDYTLRAFPNHPRALLSMTRLSELSGMNQPQGARYTTECYYDRALRFRPDDATVRALYAHFLIDRNRYKEARKQLELATDVATDEVDPQVSYNIGLAYFKLKDYDKSLQYAQDAYRSGVPFAALKEKLQAVGKWRESD